MLPARKQRAYEGPECPRCGSTLPASGMESRLDSCAHCKGGFSATWFPPLAQPAGAVMAPSGPTPGASCSRHAGNVAEAACGRCGAFMCGLCRIDADGHVLCTVCYEKLSSEGQLASTVLKLRNWAGSARIALVIGLICCLMPIGGAFALYYASKGVAAKKAANETAEIAPLRRIQLLSVVWILVGGLAYAMWVVGLLLESAP